MVTGRLLAVPVRGASAWILWQVSRDALQARIRQLEVDPYVHRDVVRQLRGTAADLEEAARQYRESARSAAESGEASGSVLGGGLERPLRWRTAGSVAASLGCSERWVTQLCLTGRLAAVKQGRIWLIDPDSVQDYKRRGADAA